MAGNSGQLSHGCEKVLGQEKCGSVEGCRKLHAWNDQSTRRTERKWHQKDNLESGNDT